MTPSEIKQLTPDGYGGDFEMTGQIDDVLTKAIDYYISGNGVHPEAISRVKSIIRTEKLKLLAEVKERIVSGDEPGVTNIMIAAEHADQIKELNKLEAEL